MEEVEMNGESPNPYIIEMLKKLPDFKKSWAPIVQAAWFDAYAEILKLLPQLLAPQGARPSEDGLTSPTSGDQENDTTLLP